MELINKILGSKSNFQVEVEDLEALVSLAFSRQGQRIPIGQLNLDEGPIAQIDIALEPNRRKYQIHAHLTPQQGQTLEAKDSYRGFRVSKGTSRRIAYLQLNSKNNMQNPFYVGKNAQRDGGLDLTGIVAEGGMNQQKVEQVIKAYIDALQQLVNGVYETVKQTAPLSVLKLSAAYNYKSIEQASKDTPPNASAIHTERIPAAIPSEVIPVAKQFQIYPKGDEVVTIAGRGKGSIIEEPINIQVMEGNYHVIEGVQLIGSPVVVSYGVNRTVVPSGELLEFAVGPERVKLKLPPDVNFLSDPGFYQGYFFQNAVLKGYSEINGTLGLEPNLASKVAAGNNLGINAHTADILKLFEQVFGRRMQFEQADINVLNIETFNYLQAFQFLGQESERLSVVKGKYDHYSHLVRFRDGSLRFNEPVPELRGLANVDFFAAQADSSRLPYWDLLYSRPGVHGQALVALFQKPIEEKARQTNDLKGVNISAVSLSSINWDTTPKDRVIEYRIAASYLV